MLYGGRHGCPRERRARIAVLAATALAVAAPAAQAVVFTPLALPACATPASQECVVAVTRNGVAATPADGSVLVTLASPAEGHPVAYASISARIDGPGGAALAPGDVWSVTIDTGALRPTQVTGRGRDVAVVRGGDVAEGYTVAITARPVRMAFTDTGCGGSGICPAVADTLSTGTWDAQIDDGAYYDAPEDRLATRGFHFFSSTDWFSTPPQLDYDTHAIAIDVANSHFEPDGTTVFHGSAELLLPDPMLQRLYLVDDPATLTAGAFRVTAGAGPAPTTVVTRLASAVRVQIDGLEFSRRRLRVVGRPVPGAPRRARAARVDGTRAVLAFARARARGSRVRGYAARCVAGGDVVRRTAARPPLRLRGLVPGRAYRCALRATSRAGLGATVRVTVPRRAR